MKLISYLAFMYDFCFKKLKMAFIINTRILGCILMQYIFLIKIFFERYSGSKYCNFIFEIILLFFFNCNVIHNYNLFFFPGKFECLKKFLLLTIHCK